MEAADEPELVLRAQAGERLAFERLYARHAHRVSGLCRRLLGSCPEVEDAVNEVFLKMSRSLQRLDADRPLAPWLLATASNHCLNLLRRRGLERARFAAPATEDDEQAAAGEAPPLTAIEGRERLERLSRAMDALPDRLRVPLVLRYQRELSYRQIADELGISKQNAAVLLHRAKLALRAAMKESR